MLSPFTHIPTHEERQKKTLYTDYVFYNKITRMGRFIQLYPGDTHQKYGEIIDAWDAGIKVRITRVVRNPSVGGKTQDLGSIHFIPWSKCTFAHCTEAEAEDYSVLGYDERYHSWRHFVEKNSQGE